MLFSLTLSYIDPGTGSFLLQLLIGGALGGLATMKLYWGRVRAFVKPQSRTGADAQEE